MALVARRLSLRSRLRRLPPRVAARRPAVDDRRRALRPGDRRPVARAPGPRVPRRGRRAARALRGGAGPARAAHLRDRHRAARPLVVGGTAVARRGARAARAEHGVELVTASTARERHPGEPRPLRRSSWGEDKDLRTWDSPAVADLAWGARRLELRAAARRSPPASAATPPSGRRASCSRCRRATGPSSIAASRPATTRGSARPITPRPCSRRSTARSAGRAAARPRPDLDLSRSRLRRASQAGRRTARLGSLGHHFAVPTGRWP